MSEEGLSNIEKQNNDLIKLQTNFNNLQKLFVEEKEKNLNLEKKNIFLENELKKIQKLNFDNEKEMEEMRQDYQKLQAEKDACLAQKDDKINSLEEKMKKASELFEKKNNELTVKLKDMYRKYLNLKKVTYKFGCCIICQSQLNHENVYILKNCNHAYHHYCITRWISEGSKNCPCCRVPATLNNIKQFFVEKASDSSDEFGDEFTQSSSNMTKVVNNLSNKYAKFVKIKNKWSEINRGYSKCCDKECIQNKDKGSCIEGNGFGNLINDEIIKYVVKDGGYNRYVAVYAENSFNKPQNCLNYSLHYFEIKCKLEGRLSKREQWMFIGIQNLSTNKNIYYYTNNSTIYNEKCETIKLSTSFNNNDIFGCGLVYPPTNSTNKFPYIFFTQNGKQIGKAMLLKDNSDSYKPFVWLKCCFVKANFGNDLETKPFNYDITKYLVLDEFY